MAKRRKCRFSEEELAIHEEAVRLRKMTDEQLVKLFHSESVAETSKEERNEARSEENTPNVENFLDGLARGECKGIKGATVFKLLDYARENGYITAGIETEESNG